MTILRRVILRFTSDIIDRMTPRRFRPCRAWYRVPAILQRCRRRGLAYALPAAFSLFFVWCVLDGLDSWFSCDDLMNLHNSLARGLTDVARGEVLFAQRPFMELVRDNLLFWSHAQRPLGAMFYRLMYDLWGFNPFPYRLVILVLLTLNFWLMWAVVRRLSQSAETAIGVMFLIGVHAGFASIYYDTGMVYDALAFFFYYATFLWYLLIRARGKTPGRLEAALALGLFICALNAKEIAASLPFALLLFEWFWHRPRDWSVKELGRWVAGPARFCALAALVDLLYVIGKVSGEGSIVNHPAYHPTLSSALLLKNLAHYLSLMVHSEGAISPTAVVLGWSAMAAVSFLTGERYLKWAVLMSLLAYLPLAFILPRNAFAFYLPAVPWALWIAGFLVWVLRKASGLVPNRKAAWGLHLCARCALAAMLVFWLAPFHARMLRDPLNFVHRSQNANRHYAEQIRKLLPALPRGAKLLVLNDPYPAGAFDGLFLLRLTLGDPGVRIVQTKFPWMKGHHPDPEHYDAVLDFRDGQFVLR